MIDSLWLDMVQADGPVAVGGVFEFRGKPPALAKIRARIAEILPDSPRLRQIPAHSRTGVLQPTWQDAEPDLNHHVTRRPSCSMNTPVLRTRSAPPPSS